MVDLFGHHRADDGDVIGHFLVPREVVRDVLAGLAVFFELGEVALHLEGFPLKLGDGLALGEGLGHGLAIQFVEFRFVVEGFEVRRPARHTEENDPFGLGGVMGEAGESLVAAEAVLASQKLGKERAGPEGQTGILQKGAAVEEIGDLRIDHGQRGLGWELAGFSFL